MTAAPIALPCGCPLVCLVTDEAGVEVCGRCDPFAEPEPEPEAFDVGPIESWARRVLHATRTAPSAGSHLGIALRHILTLSYEVRRLRRRLDR